MSGKLGGKRKTAAVSDVSIAAWINLRGKAAGQLPSKKAVCKKFAVGRNRASRCFALAAEAVRSPAPTTTRTYKNSGFIHALDDSGSYSASDQFVGLLQRAEICFLNGLADGTPGFLLDRSDAPDNNEGSKSLRTHRSLRRLHTHQDWTATEAFLAMPGRRAVRETAHVLFRLGLVIARIQRRKLIQY